MMIGRLKHDSVEDRFQKYNGEQNRLVNEKVWSRGMQLQSQKTTNKYFHVEECDEKWVVYVGEEELIVKQVLI